MITYSQQPACLLMIAPSAGRLELPKIKLSYKRSDNTDEMGTEMENGI